MRKAFVFLSIVLVICLTISSVSAATDIVSLENDEVISEEATVISDEMHIECDLDEEHLGDETTSEYAIQPRNMLCPYCDSLAGLYCMRDATFAYRTSHGDCEYVVRYSRSAYYCYDCDYAEIYLDDEGNAAQHYCTEVHEDTTHHTEGKAYKETCSLAYIGYQ